MMATFCPEHPGRTGNDLPGGECRWCIQEAVLTDHAAGVAAVRAELAKHRLDDTQEES